MTFREMTVADLIARLSEFPDHYPVAPLVNGMAGVVTDVWCQNLGEHQGETPTVLLGEAERPDAIVPPDWRPLRDQP